tara:strand:+ start:149 stop:337 length:189 start_codon:yes stop_codon:yes gene_type:complete
VFKSRYTIALLNNGYLSNEVGSVRYERTGIIRPVPAVSKIIANNNKNITTNAFFLCFVLRIE